MSTRNQPTNLAAIDIGTNSFHLIIARMHPERGRFTTLDREKEIVRLGAGTSTAIDMKYISDSAMKRGIQTLKRFKTLADAYNAPIHAVATSAVREALNKDVFARRVQAETGIKIEIVPGIEEARLIYLGILQALPVYNKKVLMVDIGGGSTEFLLGQKGRVRYANSLKVGAVRLTQKFFRGKTITKKQIEECRSYIKGAMAPIVRSIGRQKFDVAVGSSGTIVNIAAMIRAKKKNIPAGARINNFSFTKKELTALLRKIYAAKTQSKRMKLDRLDPARADIITAGALILEQVFDALKVKKMTVSEYALREGLLLDANREKKGQSDLQHLSDIRYSSVLHVAENFNYEREHALQVTALAGNIFQLTQKLHKLGDAEREFLEAAAILHEVGFFISHSDHHRHSYYLIRNSELFGFTENEKEIVANVARYHRKSHPQLKHDGFSKLLPHDQQIVTKLAAILRIADGLDRTHLHMVKNVTCQIKRKTVTFTLHTARSTSNKIDLWGADRKKKLFEETFGVKVKFRIRKAGKRAPKR